MTTEAEFDQILQLYPVLRSTSLSLMAAVQADMVRIVAPAERVLFDLDSACSMFLLPFAGAIRVVKPALSGREILLYRLGPGDSCILTVSCLLGHSAYPARGIVERDLIGYAISQAMFQRLVAESPGFRQFIFRYFAERIAELMQLVEEVAFGAIDQRLANYLAERAPQVVATHQVIADELGTVREVVSRRLKQLESAGLIRLERGRSTVLDASRLQQFAAVLRDSSH